MKHNTFLQNDSNIKDEQSNKALGLLTLKNNPWRFFSKYNNTFDTALGKVCSLKKDYHNMLIKYQDKEREIKENEETYTKNKLSEKSADFRLVFSIFLATFSSFFSFIDNMQSNLIILLTFFTFFLFYMTIVRFTLKKYQRKKLIKQNRDVFKQLLNIEDDLKSIKSSYNNHIKSLLEHDFEINIRKELNKHYYSDTAEINAITQYILEEIYPEEKKFKITYDIEDDIEEFSKISGDKHIHKISNYLNKLIDKQTYLIVHQENLNNEMPLVLTANSNISKSTVECNETLKFFN